MTDEPTGNEHDALAPHEKQQTELVHNSAVAVIAAARALKVRDLTEAQHAHEVLGRIAGERKRAEAARTALVKPLNDHVRMINATFKAAADTLAEADAIVRRQVIAYNREQERLRREEQARIDAAEAARRQADELERELREAAARQQREQWEREAATRAAHAAGHATPEALAAAQAAEEAAKAMAVLEAARAAEPLPVRPVEIVPAPAPVSKGVASKRRWTFEVVDPEQVPREFVTVDTAAIRRRMHADIREAGKPQWLPGVRFYQEDELAVRAT